MKITDIMIGDWVDVRNSADKDTPHIERITPAHLLRDEPCLGIPITPEILKKNGFIKNQEWDWWVHYGDFPLIDFLLHEDENGHYVDLMNARIKYIHQLQQAMRLCGINKEITLN